MLLSFGDVATLTVQAMAAIFSVILYVFLAGAVFPPIFLKPRYRYSAEGDRGIRRYAFEGGRAIVYEPSAPYRHILKQYILSANGREKYIKCKFIQSVYYVIYDVIAFDSGDRVIDTVRVEEDMEIGQQGISKASLLPGETAYVQVTYLMGEQSTRDREFGPLEKIRDNHPKYVISATPFLTSRDENGIKHISLREFLNKGL